MTTNGAGDALSRSPIEEANDDIKRRTCAILADPVTYLVLYVPLFRAKADNSSHH